MLFLHYLVLLRNINDANKKDASEDAVMVLVCRKNANTHTTVHHSQRRCTCLAGVAYGG